MGIFINDDFANFYYSAPITDMNEAGLARQIDYYTRAGGVEAVIFNLNASCAHFRSKVLDQIWEKAEYLPDGRVLYKGKELDRENAVMCLNMREMYRNVEDPTPIRRKLCHDRGVEFFLSIRTNDMHGMEFPKGQDPVFDTLRRDSYWVQHPELRRASYRRGRTQDWGIEAYDYGFPEVRARFLALAKEYLDCDPDGFEIDFMRHVPTFRPGYDEAGIPLMNDFVKEIRRMADESSARTGHRVRISVRVPSAPEDAYACGLDVAVWAKNGWIDIVTPSPQFCANESDMPLEMWRRMLPDSVKLVPCIELHGKPANFSIPMFKTNPDFDRSWAAMYYYRGADDIYLYNHFPYGGDAFSRAEDMQQLYADLARRDVCEKGARRHYVTYRDNSNIEGRYWSSFMPWAIPPKQVSNCQTRINVGGGTAGRKARLIFGTSNQVKVLPEVRFNAEVVTPDHAPENMPVFDGAKDLRLIAYPLPEGLLHDGSNLIEMYLAEGDAVPVTWLEVQIAAGDSF